MIKTFLPQPLSDVEIDDIIENAMQTSGASSMQDMGKVMAIIKPLVQGRADISAVSAKVKARL
ncbi:hypothetical protein D791_01527 [Nitrincola nitratireducens]|uniref:GatB/YqeY domain-containing protein n=1 Tax=Nitrincola nitratireducens TaxID=1229521 RepID=W9UWY6_9GAMM|nr:hypothetical protein D791_01527 [Nitrincola nitratireducens]